MYLVNVLLAIDACRLEYYFSDYIYSCRCILLSTKIQEQNLAINFYTCSNDWMMDIYSF